MPDGYTTPGADGTDNWQCQEKVSCLPQVFSNQFPTQPLLQELHKCLFELCHKKEAGWNLIRNTINPMGIQLCRKISIRQEENYLFSIFSTGAFARVPFQGCPLTRPRFFLLFVFLLFLYNIGKIRPTAVIGQEVQRTVSWIQPFLSLLKKPRSIFQISRQLSPVYFVSSRFLWAVVKNK